MPCGDVPKSACGRSTERNEAVKEQLPILNKRDFTMFPNVILEKLMTISLSPITQRVCSFIWRYSYGYRKIVLDTDMGFLQQRIDAAYDAIKTELNYIAECGVISFEKIKDSGEKERYRITVKEEDHLKWDWARLESRAFQESSQHKE